MSPCSFTARSEATSIAAAPSEICDATAAVTRPPSARVGSERIFSGFGSRGPSSREMSPNGTIWVSKRPSARAAMARVWDSTENASVSSREMSQSSAIMSAPRNWLTSWVP